jgi:hypothetical protein
VVEPVVLELVVVEPLAPELVVEPVAVVLVVVGPSIIGPVVVESVVLELVEPVAASAESYSSSMPRSVAQPLMAMSPPKTAAFEKRRDKAIGGSQASRFQLPLPHRYLGSSVATQV